MVTAKLAKLPKGRPAENTEISVFTPTQTEAAKLLNVSVDSVQFARKVQEQGTPELARAIEDGKVSVSAAAAMLLTVLARDSNFTGSIHVAVYVAWTSRGRTKTLRN
jgi:glutamate racemase